MNKKKFVTWMAGAIISLIVAIAFPTLISVPVTAQTVPPTPQFTTTVTSPSATASLSVYAASSLLEVLTDLENAYNNSTSTPKINFTNSLDSSGILLQNINYAPNETAGIPDVFISAATSQINTLQTAGKLASGWPQNIARNRLVLIKPNTFTAPAPNGSTTIMSFSTLVNNSSSRTGIRGIVIGNPTSAPVGEYARQLLSNTSNSCGAGTYNTLLNKPAPNKLYFASNARNVLRAVETKNLDGNIIDAGIVYATDKQISTLSSQVGSSAPSSCLSTPIVYPEAVLRRTRRSTAANAFANFLINNQAARNTLTNRGFLLP